MKRIRSMDVWKAGGQETMKTRCPTVPFGHDKKECRHCVAVGRTVAKASCPGQERSSDVAIRRRSSVIADHDPQSMLQKHRLSFLSFHGFSLMELIVTITIIIILSVISGPLYNSYSFSAKQAEGYALLGAIRSAQERYYTDWGKFLEAGTTGAKLTSNDPILGINARSNKYYTWFIANENSNTNSAQHAFTARVYGNGVKNLQMIFSREESVLVS